MAKRRRLVFLVSVLAFGSLAGGVRGADGLDVAIGLGGRVVPALPAPLRVVCNGLSEEAVRLRVVQNTGGTWLAGATISYEVPVAPSDAEECEEVFMIHDVALPLRVLLLTADGRVLARREVDLRSAKEDGPFPVGVGGFATRLPEPFALLSPAELPRAWSAYSAAESVWIGHTRSGLDADRWDALARWVLSGGSLVVFTGGDFFLLDAPRLRELLPIVDPILTTRNERRFLTGDLRGGAAVLASKEGIPWIVSAPYGVGTVTLVSTDASTLEGDDLSEIRSCVPRARAVSLLGITSDLLDLQPVRRPNALAALALVGLSILALRALAARRGRWRSAAVIGVFGLLTVGSYLYAAPRALSDAYQTNVRWVVGGSLAASVTCSASVSAARESVAVRVRADGSPFEVLQPGNDRGSYTVSATEGSAWIALAPGERRLLAVQRDEPSFAQAALTRQGELLVTSRLPRSVDHALLLLDGEVFALPSLEPGETAWRLGDPLPWGSRALGAEGDAIDRLFEGVARMLPLERGTWLVAGEVTETTSGTEARTSARDIVLYVIEVERD
ncbi:MAG: hypothetical protein PHV11_03620 [Candidatus Bipolaricaulis sp.]|nr:hypothetical protein [Candidatus Bipolaricaulis sp.]